MDYNWVFTAKMKSMLFVNSLFSSVIKEKWFINEELSYFNNKTQLCDLFDIKLGDCFINAVFAYHNPSGLF